MRVIEVEEVKEIVEEETEEGQILGGEKVRKERRKKIKERG